MNMKEMNMKALVFLAPGKIELLEKPVPCPGPTDALIRITTTTICGTDVHILKGEYPVRPGLTIGHEPVGAIEELGSAVTGYHVGQRVIAGAITPCGQCHSCLEGIHAQCGGHPMGGGASVIPSMARKRSFCLCHMRWRTLLPFPII
jgi:alcohol dehydrogenase